MRRPGRPHKAQLSAPWRACSGSSDEGHGERKVPRYGVVIFRSTVWGRLTISSSARMRRIKTPQMSQLIPKQLLLFVCFLDHDENGPSYAMQ